MKFLRGLNCREYLEGENGHLAGMPLEIRLRCSFAATPSTSSKKISVRMVE